MYNSRKSKKILILLLITITVSFFELSEFDWVKDNLVITPESYTDKQPFGELRTADYSSNFDGNGEDLDISLHQSIFNATDISFLDLDNRNSFKEPSPTVSGFNSSYVNINLNGIYAPNKSITIEDETTSTKHLSEAYYTSFEVRGDGYIENISVYLSQTLGGDTFFIDLYNATYDGPSSSIKFHQDITGAAFLSSFIAAGNSYWVNFTNWHQFLDVSRTYNNTFFIRVSCLSSNNGYWHHGSDGTYDSIVWRQGGGAPEINADMSLLLGLSPQSNVASPSDINLSISGTAVIDIAPGSGYWTTSSELYDLSGKLQFQISADWWEVACTVADFQINYTKTDLVASSDFNVPGSGQTIEWNVTRNGGLNFFDSRLTNYQINFTIPASWLDPSIRVFNGAVERTLDISKRLLGNGYREIKLPNAGNGTFWHLTADSTNLISSIDTFIGIIPIDTYNFTDIAHFNTTFSTDINNGVINLSLYSPVLINNELNYSIEIQSFTAGSVISLADWDISDNVTQYGDFRVQVYWSNDTAAGFLEKTITILGETSLTPSLPGFTFNSGDVFNIDLFFNDIGLSQGISGASITHRLNNGAPKMGFMDLGSGNYRITIDCNDPDFSAYGPNIIEINATKNYYNNQSEVVQITILGETDLVSSIPKSSFNSTETFVVSLFFNDTVKDVGVSGATIEVNVNQSLYNPVSINDYLNGNYDITINCDDDIFDTQGYGYFNLSLNIEKSYYYNHTTSFIIYITGETSLGATKYPDPIIGYYNSDQTFNITAYFEDIGRSEGINGGIARVYVKEVSASSYQEYLTVIDPFGIGYYNVTIDCSDPEFSSYGRYNIKINVTKAHYYTATYVLDELVVGNTTLTIIDPIGTVSYVENEIIDITIEYIDHTQSVGINGATISYTLNGTGYRNDNIVDNLDGTYTITVNAGDVDFGSNFGNINVIIRANKAKFINLTKTFTFERQILTQLTPPNPPPLLQVIKGNSIYYEFNYSDRLPSPIVTFDIFQNTTILYGFEWNIVNEGLGNYTLELNSTKVTVIETPYIVNFSIYAFGNQSQELSFTILVTIIQTNVEIESWNELADFARSTRINVSIDFFFNDTINNQAITGLVDNDIIVKNYITDTPWSPGFTLFDRVGDGNYKLNISTVGAISGLYTLELNISKFPNYNWSFVYVQFYLRGNYTTINLISLSDPGGQLSPIGLSNYTIFEGSDIDIEFNVTDLEYSDALVLGDADSYYVWYENLNTGANGTLIHTLDFDSNFGTHIGTLTTSNVALTPGNYIINITLTKSNYESTFITFNLTIIEKYQVSLNATYLGQVDAGDAFKIVFRAIYFNGTDWLPLDGTTTVLTPIFNGIPSTEIQTRSTNSTGEILFEVTVRSDAITMNISILLEQEYYHYGDTLIISDINVVPLPSGLTLEEILPYLIIAGIAIAVGACAVAVYRGVVIPKKREKTRVLKEVKTIFDDAINLEHILVLYKATGTCIYFKSFGSEEIDPELISGFISAICSFGKDLVCQEELNEINYGDKMLLLSDGEHIRVALVLSKKASMILRRNLTEFITIFEKNYIDILPSWRGQLNIFRGGGSIVDEILSTSIILPHEITYEFSTVKVLKTAHSKEVLKVAKNLMKESERSFFFIATLLKEATEKTSKDTAEIFMGIKELRDKKMLIPIEIGTIEAQPISQQEITLLNQKVAGLTNLNQEEKHKLVNDLSQMSPAEREAYFVSLTEQREIISAPIEEKPGAAIIDNVKGAKKEIKNLKKVAKTALKQKDYGKAINICQNAVKIASSWELSGELDDLNEFIRLTKIEDLEIKMKTLEKEAKLAAKKDNFNEAAQKYKMSSKIASEIFKLGRTEMTKEVKRLSNKSKEYEKQI